MMELFMSNLWITMPTLWGGFAVYVIWYLTKAMHCSPITAIEAGQLWSIHQQTLHCSGRKWRRIKRGGQIVGFECDCGYRHVQKRPLIAHPPATVIDSQVSAFDKLHTSHNSG